MASISVAVIICVCVSCGLFCGALLRKVLSQHHLRDESRDAVKAGTGLIATLTATLRERPGAGVRPERSVFASSARTDAGSKSHHPR